MAVEFQLVIDCADANRLAGFWAAALGYEPTSPPAGYAGWDDYWRSVGVPEEELGVGVDRISDPAGRGPVIWFQVVPEAKSIKNRLHLDIRASGARDTPIEERRSLVEAEAQRLIAIGAVRRRTFETAGLDHYAVGLFDPEGNEFDIN